MTVLTIRPNGDVQSGNIGSPAFSKLNDNTDTTWVNVNEFTNGSNTGIVALGNISGSLPAGALVKQVRVRIRGGSTINPPIGAGTVQAKMTNPSNVDSGAYVALSTSNNDQATYDVTGAWQTVDASASSGPFTGSSIDNMNLSLTMTGGAGSTSIQIYELYVDVDYNMPPVATAVSPSTAQAVSTMACSWTYSDADSDVQASAVLKVFSAAQYGAGGFAPETSTPTYTRTVTGTAVASTIGPLVSGTYRFYVKSVAAPVSGQVSQSAWSFVSFTVVILPVPSPQFFSYPIEQTAKNDHLDFGLRAGLNVLSLDDSSLDVNTGSWGVNSVTASRTTVAGEFVSGVGGLKLQSTISSGTCLAVCGTLATAVVVPGEVYRWEAQLRADAGRTVNIGVRFLTSASAILLDEATPFSVTTGFKRFSTREYVAPASAAFVQLYISWAATATSNIVYGDEFGVIPLAVENLFQFSSPAQNSQLQDNIGNWVAETNAATPTRTTTAGQFYTGAGALLLSSLAAGDMVYRNTSMLPVFAGRRYSIRLVAKAAASARNVSVGVRWFNSSFTQVGADTYGAAVADLTTAFARVLSDDAFLAPAGALYAQVLVKVSATAGAAETHYVDEIMGWESQSVFDAILEAAPTVYLRMDELSGTSAVDVLAAANGTIAGGVTLGTDMGLDGTTGFTFDGTTGQITFADVAALNPAGGAFAISAWVIPTGAGGASVMFQRRITPGTPVQVEFYLGSRVPTFGFTNSLGQSFSLASISGALTATSLYHLLATYDGSSTMTLYINGEIDTQAAASGVPISGAASAGQPSIGNGAGNFFGGQMDEFAFFKSWVSPAQAKRIYSCGVRRKWGRGGAFGNVANAVSPRFEMQYSDDSGLTWTASPWLSSTAYSPDAIRMDVTETARVTDFTVRPGLIRRYRARTLVDVSGGTLTSDWAVSGPVTATNYASMLKDAYLETSIVIRMEEFSKMIHEKQTLNYPLGRADGVAQSDGQKGYGISMKLRTESQSEHDALVAMFRLSRPVLLQTPLGELFWVKFQSDPSIQHRVALTSPGEASPVRWLHYFGLSADTVSAPVRTS